MLHDDLGFTVPIEDAMRAAPGAAARWSQRLEHLAMAAGIAALVAAIVLTGGAAAMALGAIAGVAGGIVAVRRMANRAEGDRLRLDYETLMDVIAIVGAVASVVGPIASMAGSIGRASVAAAREAGDVSKVLKSATWVQRVEMTARGLHIFGIVQGVGQLMLQIPYDIIRQFDEIDKEERENPQGASPGQRRARRAMILLNAFHSGLVTVVSLGQSLHEPAPKVTSDAEIWSLAGDAAKRTPTVAEPGPGTGAGRPTVPPTDAAPPPKPTAEGPPAPRPIPVEVSPGAEQTAKGGGSEPPAPGEREGGATTARPAPATAGGAGHPGGTGAPPLSANQLVSRVRGIVNADRGAPPPTGRIRVVDAATFTGETGHPGGLGAVDPANNGLIINRDALVATPGLAERLQGIVEARAHSTARQNLGAPLERALMRRIIADVFGPGSGLPVGADSPIGQRLVDLLQATVGIDPLLDAVLHGEIGRVRDGLRERFGHTRVPRPSSTPPAPARSPTWPGSPRPSAAPSPRTTGRPSPTASVRW